MSKQIYARIGFSDIVITKEENENPDNKVPQPEDYLIGYELEDGTECDEEGNPLNK